MPSFRVAAIVVLAVAGAAFPAVGAPPQEDDSVFLDVEKKEFLDRFARFRAAGDWKALFDAYASALAKKSQKLVQPDPKTPSWTSLVDWLNREFAALPPDALAYYRGQYDGLAKLEYAKAREARDRAGAEKVVDTWFYSSVTDEALDWLGNSYFEEGRFPEAVYHWRRLLENYPDSEVPAALTAARLAAAAEAWGNPILLDAVRELVKRKSIAGDLLAGGVRTPLADWLASVKVEPPPEPAPLIRPPSVPDPSERHKRRVSAVRNDVKRWSYDLAKDVKVTAGPGRGGAARELFPAGEFPFVPAFTRLNGRPYVVFTNGARVVSIDPSKVGTNPSREREGMYWRYPDGDPIKVNLPANPWGNQIGGGLPQIGVAIDGEWAYATLFSEKRPPAQVNPNLPDIFVGTAQLACLHVRTGRVLWTTDAEELLALYRKLEFWEKNFSFSGPPLVRGDRLYLGICTSPMGEMESRVLCVDRRTGRPLWDRFICSVSTPNRMMFGGTMRTTPALTAISEDRGLLYVQTNLGVVASLDAMTGQVGWLTRYPRLPSNNRGDGASGGLVRPGNSPLLWDRRLWVLPSDANEMISFDLATGTLRPLPAIKGLDGQEWRKVRFLVGIIQGWMVLGSEAESLILQFEGGRAGKGIRAFKLPRTQGANCGKGAVDGETIYLPTGPASADAQVESSPFGKLAIFGGVGSWKLVDASGWKEPGESGNLLVAGDYLVVAASKLMIYTDVDTIRSEFARRLGQDPPSPQAWLEHGDLMNKNGRLVEAAESYLTFVNAAENDPAFEPRVRDVKTRLHANFIARGREAAAFSEGRRLGEAVEFFTLARGFSWNDDTFGEAARRLAESLERLSEKEEGAAEKAEYARRAVEEYQALILRSPDGAFKPEGSEVVRKTWKYASSRIEALVRTHGPGVYAAIERRAGAELAKAADPAAFRGVIDRYPDSRAASEAVSRLAAHHAAEQRWDRVLSVLREQRDRFPSTWTPALQAAVYEALLRRRDPERLLAELQRTSGLFAGKRAPWEGRELAWEDLVAKATAAAEGSRPAAPPGPSVPPKVGARIEGEPGDLGPKPVAGAIPTDLAPVDAFGSAPAELGPDVEVFARGSQVELWNVRENRRIWAARHPGGWIGATWTEPKEGPGVRILEVQPESPAAKGGLAKDDLVLTINGTLVSAASFDLLAMKGGKFSFTGRRQGDPLEGSVEPAAWPAAARGAVVGAAWTRDYRLAVAWEDVVASLDPATGAVSWTYSGLRDRFTVHRFHAADGRLLLHENAPADRGRGLGRVLDEAARATLPATDCFGRVLCLDDASGELAWARQFPIDGANSRELHQVIFHAPYHGRAVAVVSTAFQSGTKSSELWLFSLADGGDVRKRVFLGAQVAALHVEEASGVLWFVDASGSQSKVLRNLLLVPDAPATYKAFEARLDPKLLEAGPSCLLLDATPDHVVVAAATDPNQPQNPMRLALFSTRDSAQVVTLLAADEFAKDRAVPPVQRSEFRHARGLVHVGPDGLVLLYNEPRSKGVLPPPERRAFLTALKPVDGKFQVAWDAVVPTVKTLLDRGPLMEIHPLRDGWLVANPHALAPGAVAEVSAAVVLSRQGGGYVERVATDLVPRADAKGQALPAVLRRPGRFLLSVKGGVEVWE